MDALLERSADALSGTTNRLRRPVEADTSGGRVRGRRIGPVLRFAGIPFAAPPTGARRFRPPEPVPPWTGTREASSFAPQAPQANGVRRYPLGPRRSRTSEDCLYLNLTTPSTTGRRPVMVWFHPGGYVSGSGTSVEYDGVNLAASCDVVVVTVGYRLGPFGWLDLGPWDDEGRGATNVGLLDQLVACRWVHDNIASFGGDPTNVTLFGGSSGGASVVALMTVPDASSLFHRAIVQSAPVEHVITSDRARAVTEQILRACGATSLGSLQQVEGSRLLEAATNVAMAAALCRPPGPAPDGGLLFGPVVDGDVLAQAPAESFRQGMQAPHPLIIGTNRDEWRAFSMMTSGQLTTTQLEMWLDELAPGHAADLLEAYRSWTDGTPQAIADAIMTDRLFALPSLRLAQHHARLRADATFVYRFDWSPGPSIGAVHGIEQPFVFGRLRPWQLSTTSLLLGALPPHRLMRCVRTSWTTFARTGRPTGSTTAWPPFADGDTALVFDRVVRTERHHLAERAATWARAERS